ncbi:hypothetical protein [Lewinella sp. LCG006]|uniref:hypothetical protein n=1 Tax=Lewinella sp. LCG006 TaxID=3231911 RepID=UPI0034607464
MKYRIILTLFTCLTTCIVLGNMASPLLEGTLGGLTFINRNADVLSEEIVITPDSLFNTAMFNVKYIIRTDSNGVSIPLVFHTKGYRDGIEIIFDGQKVDIASFFPANYNHFSALGLDTLASGITVKWSENHYIYERGKDLQYFEVDLIKGTHTIEVKYVAEAWIDRSDWVKKRSLYYSLLPITFWKSQGDIRIKLDYSNVAAFLNDISVNLNSNYEEDKNQQSRSWTLSEIEDEYLAIEYTPKISTLSKWLIKISPTGITFIFTILLGFLHLWCIRYGRNQSRSVRKFLVYSGGLTVPILVFLIYMYSYFIIDDTLADHASAYHGYTFLTIIFVPFGVVFQTFIANWYNRALGE